MPGLGIPVPSVPLPGHPPRRKGLGKVDSSLGWEGVSLIPVPTEGSLHQPQDLSRYIRPHFIASCPVGSCPPTHAIPPEQPLQASQPGPSESSCIRRVGSRQAGHCYLRRAWTSHPAGLPCGCVPGHSGLSLTQRHRISAAPWVQEGSRRSLPGCTSPPTVVYTAGPTVCGDRVCDRACQAVRPEEGRECSWLRQPGKGKALSWRTWKLTGRKPGYSAACLCPRPRSCHSCLSKDKRGVLRAERT